MRLPARDTGCGPLWRLRHRTGPRIIIFALPLFHWRLPIPSLFPPVKLMRSLLAFSLEAWHFHWKPVLFMCSRCIAGSAGSIRSLLLHVLVCLSPIIPPHSRSSVREIYILLFLPLVLLLRLTAYARGPGPAPASHAGSFGCCPTCFFHSFSHYLAESTDIDQ